MRTPIILDVDTGIDDALALMLAARHPDLDLRAVTCVSGNTTLANVVANTCAVLDLAGAEDVAVAAGAQRPLIEPARDAAYVHGADGLGNLGLPASGRSVDRRHADIFSAELAVPALTTLRSPLREIGTRAMETLIDAERNRTPTKVVLPLELVVRESTAAPTR